MSLFADDCVLYLSGNNWLNVQRKIQTDVNAFIEWTHRNSLRLNPSFFCFFYSNFIYPGKVVGLRQFTNSFPAIGVVVINRYKIDQGKSLKGEGGVYKGWNSQLAQWGSYHSNSSKGFWTF